MADVAGFSMVAEAKALKLVGVVNTDNATGYAGVLEQSDGKFQARFHDTKRKKLRAVPGRYASAEEAALARAYAMHVQDTLEEGESLPSPARRKKRRCSAAGTPGMPVAMATPMTAATGVPFAAVQPLAGGMPVATAVPMAAEAMGGGFWAPQAWEVTDRA